MFKRPATKGSTGPLALPGLRLPERGQKILVAVSGGLDSMVLLHALKSLAVECRWKLAVAHFNHHLRGRASDADEACVAKTAAAMNLPFFSAASDVQGLAANEKVSIEMAARRLRHEFLARTARENGIKTIALAHHADDQVELFFLRLLRGAGGSGLGGMQWRSLSPADARISLIRPLLDMPRAALENFARENRIRYREDATNRVHDFLRNRIRHELLPLLRTHYQPGLNKTILRSMEIAGAESNLIAGLAQAWLNDQPFWRGKQINSGTRSRFVQAAFEKLPIAIQRQVLILQFIELGIGPDFELVESIRLLPDKPIALSPNTSLSRDMRGQVSRRQRQTQQFDDHSLTVKLRATRQALFDGVRFNWKFLRGPVVRPSPVRLPPGSALLSSPVEPAGTELFDADKIGEEIVLRHWRVGDRFQPIGLKSEVKLQDLFTNAKIRRERRHGLVMAEGIRGIFWIEGLRISELFKLTVQTKRILAWNWRRM